MALFQHFANWPEGKVAKRIVSLVPSITELLSDLGLEEEVVGITKFCIHPESWFRSKHRVGGTKNVRIGDVKALQPGLVIANREENVSDQVMAIAGFTDVWLTDISTLEDALGMIDNLGMITGKKSKASEINTRILEGFQSVPSIKRPLSAGYLIWQNPYMAAGSGTFIHDIMQRIGLQNIWGTAARYPEVDLSLLYENQPDLLLLSSEPYPFSEKHIAAISTILPHTKVYLVDGAYFSWYGSRLLGSGPYLGKLVSTWNQTF